MLKRTATNRKTNRYYCILNFLQGSSKGDEWHRPKVLASKLNIPVGTVKRVLRELHEKRLVIRDRKGVASFYAAAKLWTGDFNRLVGRYGTKRKHKVHGITLKLEASKLGFKTFPYYVVQKSPLGGNMPIRERFGVERYGLTSFQLSRKTLMVYCGCDLEPKDYDGFVLWLKEVNGFLRAKGWSLLEGNLNKWMAVELGIGDDFKSIRDDKICVTLQSVQGFLARVYDKPELGENMVRAEVHTEQPIELGKVLQTLGDGVTHSAVEQNLGHFADALNSLTARDGDVVRAVGKLNDRMTKTFDAMTRKINKLLDNPVVSKKIEERLDSQDRNIIGAMNAISDLAAAMIEVRGFMKDIVELERLRVQQEQSRQLGENDRRRLYG